TGHIPQTAFMLHQAFELAYRAAERLAMGREKVCHGIGKHQKYIFPFIPELGRVFSAKKELDVSLLHLLDMAYREVRYRAYDVPPEHITVLQAKLEQVLAIVDNEFHTCYYSCKK